MALVQDLGPYRIDTRTNLLLRGGAPVALGSRAVAILQALVARSGALVTKEELFAAAWPGLAVEDSNLTVQIAALRRALADGEDGTRWIETLPRRGYRYVGPVGFAPAATPAPPTLPDRPSVAVLPFRNLSDNQARDYFCDGMAEAITVGLARNQLAFRDCPKLGRRLARVRSLRGWPRARGALPVAGKPAPRRHAPSPCGPAG